MLPWREVQRDRIAAKPRTPAERRGRSGGAGYFLWPASHAGPAADKRAWAEPVAKAGVPNLHRVSDDVFGDGLEALHCGDDLVDPTSFQVGLFLCQELFFRHVGGGQSLNALHLSFDEVLVLEEH